MTGVPLLREPPFWFIAGNQFVDTSGVDLTFAAYLAAST
jgi:hypothetical protein